jgi:tRNA uridine 5-carboxymethylaminomethyl modification enzyme
MFTSRAERRLLLRQDNARYRLLDAAERLGIAPRAQLDETRAFASLIDAERERIFTERGQGRTLDVHLCREGVEYADLPGANPNLPAEVIEQVVLAARYRGYLEREETLARKMREQERVRIPDWIDYSAISVMRYESREKLQRVRPANLGQAARIPGVNPADIALLSVVIHRGPPA